MRTSHMSSPLRSTPRTSYPSPQCPYGLYRLAKPRFDAVTEILRGLHQLQKTIDPKFFYDARGARLYEKITQTADYYLTRTENEILRRNAESIAALVGRRAAVIEPGAGNCQKIEYLLEALRPSVYVPIDVSSQMLEQSCERLATTYQWLECVGVVAEFDQIDYVAELLSHRHRLVFFPGSTLGNMEPNAAIDFLRRMRKLIGLEGGILIGVDNIKDERILNCAYNDRLGITAAFNKNVLCRVNQLADADFSLEKFRHHAFFNRDLSRIEMHLISIVDQVVHVGGQCIEFERGETIHTENSYKYSRTAFRALAAEAGLQYVRSWHDPRDYFTVYYLTRNSGS